MTGPTTATLEFFSAPIFDYSEYLENGVICDCTIECRGAQYKAHRVVLANSSTFFYNAFTSGMTEEEKRVVKVSDRFADMFPKVLNFIYTGAIDVEEHEIIPLLEQSEYLGITSLGQCLCSIMDPIITEETLLAYIRQCYDTGCKLALERLVPYMAKFFNTISVKDFSDALDVFTFCLVVKSLELPGDEAVGILNAFLDGYTPNEQEKARLDSVVGCCSTGVKPVWRD